MATVEEDKKPSASQKKTVVREPEVTPNGTPKPSKTWIYYGPTIMNGKLKKNSSFTNGFPELARAVYEKHVEVQELLVHLDDSLEVHIDLFDKSSVASVYYTRLEEMVKRGEI